MKTHQRHRFGVPGDEQLGSGVRDADGVEHLVEIERYESVARPLREPRDGDNEEHPLPVSGGLEERSPADVCCIYGRIEGFLRHTEQTHSLSRSRAIAALISSNSY